MRARGAAALAVATAALALLAAGCGGTSKEDYQKEIDKISRTLDEQSTALGRDIQTSGSLPEAAPHLRKGAQALDDAAAELEDVDPPDDAKSAHEKIVAGVEETADAFRSAAVAASANDSALLRRRFNDIQASPGIAKVVEGREELEKAGYEIGG